MALAEDFGIPYRALDTEAARALEPSLAPVFRHAVLWEGGASVTNPLAVTRAYAARFAALGGVVLTADARSLHRTGGRWRVETDEGPIDAAQAVVALGPWAPDVLAPLGIKLPLGIKRGYHRHFRPAGNAALTRPVLDDEIGYCLAPMEQGIRLTTGAEFAARDAPPTPVQFAAAAAGGQGAVSARRAGRGEALDGQPAVLCGFPAGDRPRARASAAFGSPMATPIGD